MKEDILSAFEHYLSVTFWKFVIGAIRYCVSRLWRYFLVCRPGKGHQISPRSVEQLLLFEHNFRYNAEVLRATLQRITPKFSSIMFLTQYLFHWLSRSSKESWVKICYPKEAHNATGHNTDRPVPRAAVRSSVL